MQKTWTPQDPDAQLKSTMRDLLSAALGKGRMKTTATFQDLWEDYDRIARLVLAEGKDCMDKVKFLRAIPRDLPRTITLSDLEELYRD